MLYLGFILAQSRRHLSETLFVPLSISEIHDNFGGSVHNHVVNITVLTMVPDQFESFLKAPLILRAAGKNTLHLSVKDIRDYAGGSFRHIDDSPFGGGAGMILKCEPVLRCLDAVRKESSHVIAFTPAGTPYTQKKARELSKTEDLILLCGHFEGFDERILEAADEEISLGDYILSSGELPAMVLIDSLVRLLEGTLRSASTEEESFEDGLLEYPQYTKPRSFRGREVPDILLSGHAENIRKWRLKESLRRTMNRRPDLLKNRNFSREELKLMEEIENEKQTLERDSDHLD